SQSAEGGSRCADCEAVYANYNGENPYLIKDITDPATQRYLNAEAFSIPDAFTFGNTARQLS
ncbi:MAG: hypothetical protein P8Y80_05210, partial [Acidobacteriota bacterium]